MTPAPFITFNHVTFGYTAETVLEDVHFTLQQGDFVGLIGPNGGGKSTLLKLLAGLLTPNSGSVTVMGKKPSEVIESISYVPQSLKNDPKFPLSVRELVSMGRLSHLPWYGQYRRVDLEKADEAMEMMGISHLAHRNFGTLSSGQAQRALIARAIASEPQLLLLDEPTANVDAASEEKIYTFLRQLPPTITLVMVTHDIRAVVREVGQVLSVEKKVVPIRPEDVCEHFAYGVYHPRLAT